VKRIRAPLQQGSRNGLSSASLEIRWASRARAPDSPSPGEDRDVRTDRPDVESKVPGTGGADCHLLPHDLDACGCAAGHEFPVLVKPIECGDFAGEVVEYFGLLACVV
jgi:hypothetical protein